MTVAMVESLSMTVLMLEGHLTYTPVICKMYDQINYYSNNILVYYVRVSQGSRSKSLFVIFSKKLLIIAENVKKMNNFMVLSSVLYEIR